MQRPPLEGIRVLDLSRVLTGPFCSMILSDLGAEVIKVEMPGSGDDTRHWPPMIQDESSYFMAINRNKKSITLNLKTDEAKEALHKIAEKCDVVLENFRPGVTKRLGVDYKALNKINQKLIYCSISSYGQTGPYAQLPGYDMIVQGMSGIMSITGDPDGPPYRSGLAITDIGAGMWAALSILSALRQRDYSGKGQYLDVSMLDCATSWLTSFAGNYFATGVSPNRLGNAHFGIVPYQNFEAGDGKHILLAVGNDKLFAALCTEMELPVLINDPMFSTAPKRAENREILIPILAKRFKVRNRDEWVVALRECGVPCGPINSIGETLNDDHLLGRDMVTTIDHPKLHYVKQLNFPVKFSDTELDIRSHPPMLGENTVEILSEIAGYDEYQIKILKEKNAI